jgi:hypothetical protein
LDLDEMSECGRKTGPGAAYGKALVDVAKALEHRQEIPPTPGMSDLACQMARAMGLGKTKQFCPPEENAGAQRRSFEDIEQSKLLRLRFGAQRRHRGGYDAGPEILKIVCQLFEQELGVPKPDGGCRRFETFAKSIAANKEGSVALEIGEVADLCIEPVMLILGIVPKRAPEPNAIQ